MTRLFLILLYIIVVRPAYAEIPLHYSDSEPPLPFYDKPYVPKTIASPRAPRRQALPDAVKHAELSDDIRARAENLAVRIFGDKANTSENFAVPSRPPQQIMAQSSVPEVTAETETEIETEIETEKQASSSVSVTEAVKAIGSSSGTPVTAQPDGNGRGSYVARESIESLLRDGLDNNIDGSYLMNVSGLSSSRGYFVRLTDHNITAEREYVTTDADRSRFEAAVFFRSGGTFERVVFRGRIEPAVTVLVPAEAIPADTIITADMLTETVISAAAAAVTLRNAEQIIGNSATRLLRAKKPLRTRDVRAPMLIKRNAVIDIEYHAPGVFLRATGTASENGAKGEIIRARNLSGDKVIYAQVIGVNQARAVDPQSN